MLAAGSLRHACPSCRARVSSLSGQGIGFLPARHQLTDRSNRLHSLPSPANARPVRLVRSFTTSRRRLQDVKAERDISSGSPNHVEGVQSPTIENTTSNSPTSTTTEADMERTVHEARQRFRDTLPKDYLNEQEYALYLRHYGPPLRETTPEDVGIPFANQDSLPGQRPARGDADDPVLLRSTEYGEIEEVAYTRESVTGSEDGKGEPGSEGMDDARLADDLAAEPNDDSLLDNRNHYINAVARNQREYDALMRLQRDFEAASLRSLENAEERAQNDEVAASDAEGSVQLGTFGQGQSSAIQGVKEVADEPASEEVLDDFFEDGDDELDPVFEPVKTHAYTRAGQFSTYPKTLLLPSVTFTGPISQLLERASIKHVREAAEKALGGEGLPNSPATPASKRSLPQEAVGLQAAQHKMSPIDADAFMATVMPPAYASARGVLVEVRKRLGTDWIRNLLRRGDGKGPRVLDAGTGGAAISAWQDVLQAEWDAMNMRGEVKGANPPGKKTVVVGSDMLRNRVSQFLPNTTFLPRLPDYVHSVDNADQLLDAPHVPQPRKQFDVIIASYNLLPIKEGHRRKALLNQLWSLLSPEGGVLIFIEKAHPRGFEAVADMRSKLLKEYIVSPTTDEADPDQETSTVTDEDVKSNFTRVREPGMIVAPCTNHKTCPMYTVPGKSHGRKDFCSFQQRFVRPRFLQQVLGAKQSNHDDVQFSYVAIQRGVKPKEGVLLGEEATTRAFEGYEDSSEAPDMLSLPRQILPPLKRKGHVQLEVCTPSARIERWTVPKSRGRQSYHDARKASWGDLWALGAKVRLERNVRLGRPKVDGDGGVRAGREKEAQGRKGKTITLEYNNSGITGAKEKNSRPERRTKDGKKLPRKSLKEQILGE